MRSFHFAAFLIVATASSASAFIVVDTGANLPDCEVQGTLVVITDPLDENSCVGGGPSTEPPHPCVCDLNASGGAAFVWPYVGGLAGDFVRIVGDTMTGKLLIVNALGEALHIKDTATGAYALVETEATNGIAGLRVKNDGNTWTWEINGVDALQLGDDATTDIFYIQPGAPTQSISITASGNVGIGTETASRQFHVRRNTSGVNALIETTAVGGDAGIELKNDAETWRCAVTGNDDFECGDSAESNILTIQDGAPAFSIYIASSGRVGIGLVPGQKLEVYEDVEDNVFVRSGTGLDGGTAGFMFRNANQQWELEVTEFNDCIIRDTDSGLNPFIIESGAPENALFIEATTGNIGLGTDTPDARLDIVAAAGTGLEVTTPAVTVAKFNGPSGAADVVFEANGTDKVTIGFIDDPSAGDVAFIGGTGPALFEVSLADGDVKIGAGAINGDLHIERVSSVLLNLECTGSNCSSKLDLNNDAVVWSLELAGATDDFILGDGTISAIMRVQDGAPVNSLVIEATTGDIGLGTASPTDSVHIFTSGTAVFGKIEAAGNNGTAGWYYVNDDQLWLTRVISNNDYEIFDVSGGGKPFLIQNGAPTNSLVVEADGDVKIGARYLNLSGCTPPPTTGTPCTVDDVCVDANFWYVCVATNSWKRTSTGSTW